MKTTTDRRQFLTMLGTSLGIGVLYTAMPAAAATGAPTEFFNFLGEANGERPRPFSFVQLSDAHVGFNGPPDPLGTKAFERAVELINSLPQAPDLVLFTGDLTHDTEDKDVHAQRMKQFLEISKRMKVGKVKYVPGEHDAGLDGGALYREFMGESNYSFDHAGVHFIALDNVSRAKPEVGPEQLAWLKKDIARFPKTAPIVVFTHRPLFDLKPDWEWFTSDGDEVMNILAPYQNVTVLYGHIHREHDHTEGNIRHLASRSLIFAFPDPEQAQDKKPIAFDKEHPFRNLGGRLIKEDNGRASVSSIPMDEVQLSLREFHEINGVQQILKPLSY
jgi:3',5'-cyclic AMP phosphodiesterase CpdA